MGGNVLLTGTAALQFPMPGIKETDQARLSLFSDAGQVYADSAKLEDLRYSAGFKIVRMTPIGPLSFTYASALNSESGDETEGFQFSIGSALIMMYTLAELARLTATELVGDGSFEVKGLTSLHRATPTSLSFLSNDARRAELKIPKQALLLYHVQLQSISVGD